MQVKKVRRLADWFDCLIVLSADVPSPEARLFAEAFAAHGWVRIEGRAMVPPHVAEGPWIDPAGVEGDLRAPGAAEELGRWLRARHLKRPLFWVEGAPFADLLARFPHAFSVGLAEAPTHGGEPFAPDLAVDRFTAEDQEAKSIWLDRIENRICQTVQGSLSEDKTLNVLVLYHDAYTHTSTVKEHLAALKQYSIHNVFFLSGSNYGVFDDLDPWPKAWDFSVYDVIIWHYSIRAAREHHLHPAIAEQLARFTGLKVLFIQDEYDDLPITWDWIRRAGINLVMSCAPTLASAERLYPDREVPGIERLLTLTGYVPEDRIEQFHRPLEDRVLRIAYRGRTLPYQYGTLGQEKYTIGLNVRRLAQARGIAVDIEVDETSRIYGEDWYRFMGSARATLATESGSLAADFDGQLKVHAAKAMAEGQPFADFHKAHLAELEKVAPVNVVSPKVFEAIRLRTALICFEGDYSGVIHPDLHYIPLKRDYSNVDEVFAKLEDLEFLKALTDRAYQDVIDGGAYSYRTFVEQLDEILAGRCLRAWRTEIISAPILARPRDSDTVEPIIYARSIEYALNSSPLGKGYGPRQIATALDSSFEDGEAFYRQRGLQPFRQRRPPAPPIDTVCYWLVGPEHLTVSNAGLVDGARLTRTLDGAKVETASGPGRYAASAWIDLTGPDFDEQFCWVRVIVRDVTGELRVCLFDNADSPLGPEVAAPQGPGEHQMLFVVDHPAPHAALVLRSSPLAGQGEPTGAGVFVSAEVLACSQYEPAVQTIIRTAVAAASGAAQPAAAPDPRQPSPRAVHRQSMGPDAVFTVDYWRNRGASLEPADEGVRVTTPATAWTYAAAVRLDFSGVDFDRQTCWIEVRLTEVKGAVQLGVYNGETNAFAFETNVPQATLPCLVRLKVDRAVGDMLLIRTGPLDTAGEAVFLGAELVVD